MGKYDDLFEEDTKPAATGKYAALFDETSAKSPEPEPIKSEPASEQEKRGVLGTIGDALKPFAEIPGEIGKNLIDKNAETYVQREKEGANPLLNAAGAFARVPAAIAGPVIGALGKSLYATADDKEKAMLNRVGSGINKVVSPIAKSYEEKVPADVKNMVDVMTAEVPLKPEIAAAKGGVNAAKSATATGLKASGKGLETVDKLAGKVASETSGVSEEALRMAGTKEGRQALQSAFGQQHEIGQKLVDAIDNSYHQIAANSQKVDAALNNVPAVNVANTIKNLESKIGNPTTKEMKAAAEQIRGKVDELRTIAADSPDGVSVHPKDLLEFRREVDDIIGDEFGKSSDRYVTALKDLRHNIKTDLVEAAKGTEYEKGMQELAQKLDAVDKMKQVVGKSSATREARAESVIRNINSLGKQQQREWMQNFQDVFGGNYLNEAKIAKMADQMGNEGKGAWLPRWTTGRSNIGAKVAMLPLGSPQIASRVTLPTTQKIGALGTKIRGLGERLGQ